MKIEQLRNKHSGSPAFCLGTAPHLNDLDLTLLRDHVTIAINQLIRQVEQYNFDYICFQRNERFSVFREELAKTPGTTFVLTDGIAKANTAWAPAPELEQRIVNVHSRFTTPGHAEFFSFNLENCIYAGNIIAMAIQLAVWMGCNPIYILGVDAHFQDAAHAFFDDSLGTDTDIDRVNKYLFPELKEWLVKTKTMLWARGIRLFDAGGEHSSLNALPKMRIGAAVGEPTICVTSKTFSQDDYLVGELTRYFPKVIVNNCETQLNGSGLVEFLKTADGVILGTETLNAEVIGQLPCLRFISKCGVGLDNIDFEAAARHQVQIAYQKGVNSDSVAELTLAFALMLIRNVDESVRAYRDGKWRKLAGRELAELTVGVVGYGHVGKVVTRKLAALGVGRLLVNDLLDFSAEPPAEFVPLRLLLSESDIVTLHVSMGKQNYHMVDADFLNAMKPSSYLINTSRGEVVDEGALVNGLRSGQLGGAALDVYEHEPEINGELPNCPNLLTTCHIAGSSNRAIKNMGWAAIEGLLQLFDKEPV